MSAASKHGATAEIARAIGDVLADRGFDVTVIAPDGVGEIEDFKALVLGSAVYMGHWMKPATDLVDRTAPTLAGRPVWLFSSGPVGDPPMPAENPVDVSKIQAATNAVEHRVFAGKLVRKQLSFPERAMIAALRAEDVDSRDWSEIKAWAAAIADTVLDLS